MQGIHRAFELAVDVPRICGVKFVLKLCLTRDQGIHLVRVFKHVGVGKCFIYLVKLGKKIHYGLYALAHNLYYRLVGIEFRFLFEVSHRITGREHYFALILLVDTRDYFQQR